MAVTKWLELSQAIYQSTTQVKVLSPVINVVLEVDAVHIDGRQYSGTRLGERVRALAGSKSVLRYKMGNL